MSPYSIEREMRTTTRSGPFGIFRMEEVSRSPLGRIEEGQTVELVDSKGERVGTATLEGGRIRVLLEGDVLVDTGDVRDFEKTIWYNDHSGTRQRMLGRAGVNTTDDITIKSRDGSERMHLKRI